MFSTTFISRESRGILKIGYHSLSKSEKYKETKLIWEQERKFFEIQINSIIVSKGSECYTYNKVQDTLVSPGSNKMFCPKEFFYFMKNTIFQNFDGDICTTERDGPYQYIRCWRKLIRKIDFGIIKFVLIYNYFYIFLLFQFLVIIPDFLTCTVVFYYDNLIIIISRLFQNGRNTTFQIRSMILIRYQNGYLRV